MRVDNLLRPAYQQGENITEYMWIYVHIHHICIIILFSKKSNWWPSCCKARAPTTFPSCGPQNLSLSKCYFNIILMLSLVPAVRSCLKVWTLSLLHHIERQNINIFPQATVRFPSLKQIHVYFFLLHSTDARTELWRDSEGCFFFSLKNMQMKL